MGDGGRTHEFLEESASVGNAKEEGEGAHLDDVGSHALSITDLVHVALEIEVEVLEDEVELRLGMNNVEQPGNAFVSSSASSSAAPNAQRNAPDDVLILHLLEQRNLPDSCARHSLILCLEPDLLERDDLVRLLVPRTVLRPSYC